MKSKLRVSLLALMLIGTVVFGWVANEDRREVRVAVAPVYPTLALYARKTGDVTVKVRTDANGRVVTAEAVSGPKILFRAAEEAARQWLFAAAEFKRDTSLVMSFRIMPDGTSDLDLSSRFIAPNRIEVRSLLPKGQVNRDPAPDLKR